MARFETVHRARNILVVMAAAGVSACVPENPIQPVASRAEGAALYQEHCAVCHGPQGRGDGPAAAGLTRTPADLTRIAARNGGRFDYAAVMSVIDGYKAPARAMPAFGDMLAEADYTVFDSGDGIQTPTPEPLLALARYLESIQDK